MVIRFTKNKRLVYKILTTPWPCFNKWGYFGFCFKVEDVNNQQEQFLCIWSPSMISHEHYTGPYTISIHGKDVVDDDIILHPENKQIHCKRQIVELFNIYNKHAAKSALSSYGEIFISKL